MILLYGRFKKKGKKRGEEMLEKQETVQLLRLYSFVLYFLLDHLINSHIIRK